MSYRPTTAERKRAARLSRTLRPPKIVHDAYVDAARMFLGVVDLLPFVRYQDQMLQLEGLKWHESALFGREYLVAYVDDEQLAGIAPDCDAISTVTTSIPLVFAPVGRRRSRSEAFLSILEHELVHVNQALLGLAPTKERCPTVERSLAGFFDNVRVEYQANLLQLTTWPRLFPDKYGLPLEHWSALRGWSDALESAVCGVFCPPELIGAFLNRLPVVARARFAAFGVSGPVATWFSTDHTRLVKTALELQLTREPALAEDAAFLSAVDWLHGQQ